MYSWECIFQFSIRILDYGFNSLWTVTETKFDLFILQQCLWALVLHHHWNACFLVFPCARHSFKASLVGLWLNLCSSSWQSVSHTKALLPLTSKCICFICEMWVLSCHIYGHALRLYSSMLVFFSPGPQDSLLRIFFRCFFFFSDLSKSEVYTRFLSTW